MSDNGPVDPDPGYDPIDPVDPGVDPTVPMDVVPPAEVPPGAPPPPDAPLTPGDLPPEPWYRDRKALATVIGVGLALLFLLIAGLIWWASGDDDDAAVTDSSTTTTTTSSTLPETTSSSSTSTSTTTTTTSTSTTTTTTTLPATTTAPAPTTTAAPVTTAVPITAAPTSTSIPVVTVPPGPGASLLDIIDASPDLSRLSALISDASLESELDGDPPRTIFAPSNDAIDTFERAPGGSDVLNDPARLLAFLQGHVATDGLTIAQVLALTEVDTLVGTPLEVDGAARTIEGATVLVADVRAANGFLHVIDRTVIPG